MKTKWMIIPLMVLALGCVREVEKNDALFVEGEFTLYASSGEPETRTVIQEDGRVFWSPEDCINVYYGDKSGKFTSTNTEPAASAEFTGTLGSFTLDGETEFVAAYPYSDENAISGTTLTMTLPVEQTAVEGTFADDLFISVAKSKDYNLHFYNVCGGVQFSLARGDIKKVVFRGNNGESLAGRLTVEFASDGKPQISGINAGKTSVTMTAPAGGTLKEGSWYYLVLAPQVLQKGYTMEFFTDVLVDTVSSDSPVSIRRSVWGVLKDLAAEEPGGLEAVDLGLSVKWANMNLGATKPEEFGDYYAWGDTEPYYTNLNPLVWKSGKEVGYEWPSYKWCMGTDRSITKYCSNAEYGYQGFTDDRTILDLEDDAAHVNLGGKWRMPTLAEVYDLIGQCTWIWDSYNGVDGYWVVNKTNTNNRIFLPAAGYFEGTVAGLGYYWSSSFETDSPKFADVLFIKSNDLNSHSAYRCFGFTIRPVYGDPAVSTISVESVSLDKTELELTVGGEKTLTATILPENATNQSVSWTSSNEGVATVSSAGVVTGIAVGSAVITVSTMDGGKTATCNVTVAKSSTPVAIPDAIDLGLPSGLKWASFNLGATQPEEYGFHYAWGEISPKEVYSWKTYRWCEGDLTDITKYSKKVDGKTQLDLEDDASYMNLGGHWRMPTNDEFTELRENCTMTWGSLNGVNGCIVVSKINGNEIFLPAAGSYDADSYSVYQEGVYGGYWSASLYVSIPANAYEFILYSNYSYYSRDSRSRGNSIRSVYDDPTALIVPVESVSLDKTELELAVGTKGSLTATVFPENATNKSVSWSSDNESVATVSSTGEVSGVASGTATVTVMTEDGNKTASCKVMVKNDSSYSSTVPEVIDLGLSVKWASFNIGATKPEEYGDYFAWGEVEPYYNSQDPLTWKMGKESGYSWNSYQWCMGDFDKMTKYCTKSGYGYHGFQDDKTVLDMEDDAAHVNLGSKWRMPTYDELLELRNKCSWVWTKRNGVNGQKVTGPNGNSIFFPAAGYRYDLNLGEAGSYGCVWSSSLYPNLTHRAYYLDFDSDAVSGYYDARLYGQSIRAVYVE